MKLPFFLLLSFFMAGLACVKPAFAQQNLVFDNDIYKSTEILLSEYLQKDPAQAGLLIAKADLNEDGLYEYILKTGECGKKPQFCTYKIVAGQTDTLIEIGSLKARVLALGNGYTNGIRNLRAFNNPKNDFDYDVYVWEASQRRYMIKE